MLYPNLSPNDFLTEAESLAVDQALLPAKEKFSARVALYSLRVLQAIAPEQDITAIAPEQITEWLIQHQATMPDELPSDPAFQDFFCRLVLSALKPLTQIAAEHDKSLEQIQPADVIHWFEQQAKMRVEQTE